MQSLKKLLILDINGVLADVVFVGTSDWNPDIMFENDKIKVNKQLVFKRKYCHEFLKFCFEKFVVAIWSSKERYFIHL